MTGNEFLVIPFIFKIIEKMGCTGSKTKPNSTGTNNLNNMKNVYIYFNIQGQSANKAPGTNGIQ